MVGSSDGAIGIINPKHGCSGPGGVPRTTHRHPGNRCDPCPWTRFRYGARVSQSGSDHLPVDSSARAEVRKSVDCAVRFLSRSLVGCPLLFRMSNPNALHHESPRIQPGLYLTQIVIPFPTWWLGGCSTNSLLQPLHTQRSVLERS